MKSPCIDVCKFDRLTGWCKACGRTREECRGWKKTKGKEQRKIAATLPHRLEQMAGR